MWVGVRRPATGRSKIGPALADHDAGRHDLDLVAFDVDGDVHLPFGAHPRQSQAGQRAGFGVAPHEREVVGHGVAFGVHLGRAGAEVVDVLAGRVVGHHHPHNGVLAARRDVDFETGLTVRGVFGGVLQQLVGRHGHPENGVLVVERRRQLGFDQAPGGRNDRRRHGEREVQMQRRHRRDPLISIINRVGLASRSGRGALGSGTKSPLRSLGGSVDVGGPPARKMSSNTQANGPPPADHGQATLARGATIGRYVVLGLVGRGGMGEVYAAYDPELDRKVAVKLLRVKPGNGVSLSEGRARTLREAQAIARLSHPNVVEVFDVGTFEDKVFIAMEFVEGNTLAYWSEAQPRSWQEILKVFVAAGRGLEAAHEKGLVHRDFKPDNVMIGRDGKVRVMDFGLARQVSEKVPSDGVPRRIPVELPEEAGQLDVGSSPTIVINAGIERPDTDAMHTSGSGLFDARLTRTGAMMGTPAYMAPEQFFNAPTDARTDQFSFCIALYEALYGQRPFEGNNLSTLTGNVVRGSVREPPAGTKVPPWVRRIVLRGLRPVIGQALSHAETEADRHH